MNCLRTLESISLVCLAVYFPLEGWRPVGHNVLALTSIIKTFVICNETVTNLQTFSSIPLGTILLDR